MAVRASGFAKKEFRSCCGVPLQIRGVSAASQEPNVADDFTDLLVCQEMERRHTLVRNATADDLVQRFIRSGLGGRRVNNRRGVFTAAPIQAVAGGAAGCKRPPCAIHFVLAHLCISLLSSTHRYRGKKAGAEKQDRKHWQSIRLAARMLMRPIYLMKHSHKPDQLAF